jgi:hypothetical protein
MSSHLILKYNENDLNSATKANLQNAVRKGVQVFPDGRIKNIPSNMLTDQFGIVGLLTYIKADREKDLFSLALGSDLTTLGLNLNSAEYVLMMEISTLIQNKNWLKINQ